MLLADHPFLRHDRGFSVVPFSMLTAALMLASALFIGHSTLRHMGLLMASPMETGARPAAHQIVVGGIGFRVPAGYLRFAEQERDGVLPGIDLALAWPTMAPLGDPETLRNTPRENIIFIGISDAHDTMDTTDLLGSVYREVFVGPHVQRPDGLIERRLDPEAGYVEETVVFDLTTGSGFAARCAGDDETLWETCYRDVILTNGLTVTYRFAPALLHEWERLDDTVLGFLINMARQGGTGADS